MSETPTKKNPDEANVPRTYRNGPSDPVVFSDGPGTYATVVVHASPAEVWTAVTDINLPASYSEEFLGADWDNEGGPALGATFSGRSEIHGVAEWVTTCYVDRYVENEQFGWATQDPENPGARWWFTLTPLDAFTTLRYEVTLGPGESGTTMMIAGNPAKEDRIIRRRILDLHANMARTVEGVRDTAESTRKS